ncbi:MAG: FkbM family methyltransferase [Dehalococcoidia bacterium]
MGANSAARQAIKRILFPRLGTRTYQHIQALSKAWDIRSGSFSEPELDLIPAAVRAGETALDLGANYGLYSYHLAKAVGASGHVYAFEPVPFTSRTLEIVVRLLALRNVTIVPKGCSDRTHRVSFRVPLQISGAASAGQAHMGDRNDDRPGREAQVRWMATQQVWCDVVALDHFLPDVRQLSLIKCDVEGAELLAFRGAARIIEQHRPSVICEINPWLLEGFGLRLDELLSFFYSKGYCLYTYARHRATRLLNVSAAGEIVEDNYFFVHPGRSDRFTAFLRPSSYHTNQSRNPGGGRAFDDVS